jgi:hypothetical protein
MKVTPLLVTVTPMVETSSSPAMIQFLDQVPDNMSEKDQDELSCESCYEREAEIFQVTGNYCLHCWQEECHPDV